MSTSQNGWPAYNTTAHFVRFAAAGRTWWAANADCAVVAAEFISRWDTEVESVTKDDKELDDWSWADRKIRDSDTQVSNHASATAWDINAVQHPRGVALARTFTGKQIIAVRRILADITDANGRPVLRWGGDYKASPIDGMHVEINADPTPVKQAADKIRNRKKAEMELADKVKLTAAQAKAMSVNGTPRKEGDEVSVSYLLTWGGPALERLYAHVRALETGLGAVSKAVQALADDSPDDVKAAFAQGIQELEDQLAQIRVVVTADGGTT